MPKYSWKIEELIFEEDARKMYDIADTETQRVLISLLWITGARTHEISMLRRQNFELDTVDSVLRITLKTLKLKKKKVFQVDERTLEFERPLGMDLNIYLETIIKFVAKLQPEDKVIPYTDRWIEQQITKLSLRAINKPLCPYHFRHSVMTWLAKNKLSPPELMHFKGARSLRGIMPYLHAMPSVVKLENLRRGRG